MGRRYARRVGRGLVGGAAVAALLAAGCIKDLGTPPGFVESLAVDVMADGTVVGTGTGDDGHREAFLRSPDGEWTLLGAEAPGPPDTWSDAAAVNADGTVVGTTSDMGSFFGRRVFTWDKANGFASVPVALPGFDSFEATDINAHGQVVGYGWAGEAAGSGPGFLYTPGKGTVVLAPPDGLFSARANAVNDAGTIVGSAAPPRGGASAVVWAPPAYEPVVLPITVPRGPVTSSHATSIDENGTIGGYVTGAQPDSNGTTLVGLLWAPSPGLPHKALPGLAVQDVEGETAVGTVSGEDFSVKAAIWQPGDTEPELLGTLGGYSWATDITGSHIVGYAATEGTFHAASYTPKP